MHRSNDRLCVKPQTIKQDDFKCGTLASTIDGDDTSDNDADDDGDNDDQFSSHISFLVRLEGNFHPNGVTKSTNSKESLFLKKKQPAYDFLCSIPSQIISLQSFGFVQSSYRI